jgi:hypothetical protein
MSESTDREESKEPSRRQYIGDLAISESERKDSSPLKKELRQEVFRQFVIKKLKRSLGRHVEHIVGSRQIAESVRYLFDEHGEPPRNAPLEDIIAKRKELEGQIRWLEVLAAELRSRLTSVKEIEESALSLIEEE